MISRERSWSWRRPSERMAARYRRSATIAGPMDDSRRDPRATPTLRPQDVGSAATVSADDAPGHAPTIAVGSAGGATNPAARAAFAAPPGTRAMIGHFAIDERLGAGGMGEVYAGVDVHLGRPVAIKLVR